MASLISVKGSRAIRQNIFICLIRVKLYLEHLVSLHVLAIGIGLVIYCLNGTSTESYNQFITI